MSISHQPSAIVVDVAGTYPRFQFRFIFPYKLSRFLPPRLTLLHILSSPLRKGKLRTLYGTMIGLYYTHFTEAGRVDKLEKNVEKVEDAHSGLLNLLTGLPSKQKGDQTKEKGETDLLESSKLDPPENSEADATESDDDIDYQDVADKAEEIQIAKAEVRLLALEVENSGWIQSCILPYFFKKPRGQQMVKLEKRVGRLRKDTLNTTAKALKLLALRRKAAKECTSPAVMQLVEEGDDVSPSS